MVKRRKAIPAKIEKKIYQEANSECAFCGSSVIEVLQIHHIDGNAESNKEENLILVCSNCHNEITFGKISEADVVTKKREIFWKFKNRTVSKESAAVNINISDSSFKGDIAHTITKINVHKGMKETIAHPQGSIGANLLMKGYIDYLLGRYYEYKKADSSYGYKNKFSHAVIHKNIQKKFGFKTFFMPENKFFVLVKYLQDNIDRTIQGKVNLKKNNHNYHSFDEHSQKCKGE